MKIAFHFENHTAQIVLMPECSRDEAYLTLTTEGRPNIKVKPTTDRVLILQFEEPSGQSNHSN